MEVVPSPYGIVCQNKNNYEKKHQLFLFLGGISSVKHVVNTFQFRIIV